MSSQGLSPRVRGNQRLFACLGTELGSIPARAGQPNGDAARVHWREVYPRACGATEGRYHSGVHKKGLSPRVRGNLIRNISIAHTTRSIPARAGQPPGRLNELKYKWVYPRACGATPILRVFNLDYSGLSPRVRGNQLESYSLSNGLRSIPARAGQPNYSLVA